MANLHPKTLAALEAGPQLVREVPLYDGPNVRIYETPEAFARRIALIAMEEEREEADSIMSKALLALKEAEAILGGEYGDTYAILCSDMFDLEEAIRRRGKP